VATSLTTEVIQAQIDKLYLAMANDELELEDVDGNRIKYKSNNDILRAIEVFERLLFRKAPRRGMAFKVGGGKGL
jgi:hypothetical protein